MWWLWNVKLKWKFFRFFFSALFALLYVLSCVIDWFMIRWQRCHRIISVSWTFSTRQSQTGQTKVAVAFLIWLAFNIVLICTPDFVWSVFRACLLSCKLGFRVPCSQQVMNSHLTSSTFLSFRPECRYTHMNTYCRSSGGRMPNYTAQ